MTKQLFYGEISVGNHNQSKPKMHYKKCIIHSHRELKSAGTEFLGAYEKALK